MAALAVSACTKTPKQVADNACPFIALTADDQKAERLRLLVKEGVNANEAADLLYPYDSSLGPTLSFDKREFCTALVSRDKVTSDRIIADVARQAVSQVWASRHQ